MVIEENDHTDNYNPDLGIYITKITPNMKNTSFIPFTMSHISRIGTRSFSTTVDIHHEAVAGTVLVKLTFCYTLSYSGF